MQVLICALFASCIKDNPYLMSQLNTVLKKMPNEDMEYGITLLLFLNTVLNQKIYYSSSLPDSSNRTYLFLRAPWVEKEMILKILVSDNISVTDTVLSFRS